MRMAVAECIHRDAGGEIEIAFAIGGDQPHAFAALETEIYPGKYRKQMRRRILGHGNTGASFSKFVITSQPPLPTSEKQWGTASLDPGVTVRNDLEPAV